MKINLTDDERAVAIKYAEHLEKAAGRWCFWRWSSVLAFVFSMCLLLAVGQLGKKLSSITLPDQALTEEIAPTPESNASSISLLASQIEVKAVSLRAEIFLVLKALIVAGIGVCMFVYTTSNWHRDQRDRLVAKLLRCIASEEEGKQGEEGSEPMGAG